VQRTIVVGRLTGAFGVRGEIKCVPAGNGASSFAAGRSYIVRTATGERTVRCRSARRHQEKLLLAFEEFDSPEAVRALAGAEVRAGVDEVPLEADEYLDSDLVGLRLTDEHGVDLGRVVVDVEHFPHQDYLVFDPGRKLVPLVKAFVRRVDPAGGTIAMALPDGIFD
jgi:16S rRNA processing protein RimM